MYKYMYYKVSPVRVAWRDPPGEPERSRQRDTHTGSVVMWHRTSGNPARDSTTWNVDRGSRGGPRSQTLPRIYYYYYYYCCCCCCCYYYYY